jgi:hypothetical protein
MEGGSLAQQRRKLKFFLGSSNSQRCPICNKRIRKDTEPDGLDMHEVFLTRGDVAGNEELMKRIMAGWNCVLVHHGDCHVEAATSEGQAKCMLYLLHRVGYIQIMQELSDLDEIMKSSQARTAMRIISDLYSEENPK